jgi:hypothetical protein
MSLSFVELGIELNKPYKLALASRPAKKIQGPGAENELVTFQYSFKPPVDEEKPGNVRVEKPGNKWFLEETLADVGETVRYEGTGRRPRDEHLLFWNGGEGADREEFVFTKVDTLATLKHIRDEITDPVPVPSRKNVKLRVSKKASAALTQHLPSGTSEADRLGADETDQHRVHRVRKENVRLKEIDEDGTFAKSRREKKRRRDDVRAICTICQIDENEDEILVCSATGCGTLEHYYCTFPVISQVPDGDWFCSSCVEDGHI